jgi:hypothetical protein
MLGMKRFLIVVVALFAGALPAAVLGATTKSAKGKTTTKSTTTKSTTTTTTSTTTSTTTATSTVIGGTLVLGATKTPVAPPVCPKGVQPSACQIVLTRATGLETIRDSVVYPTTVKVAGQLVAFTVGVAKLASTAAATHADIAYLDSHFGGVTEAAITILKGGKGTAGSRIWTVVAEGPLEHLQPYLGYTVEFPLTTPLTVTAGETVALTVPTWAPVLSYDLNQKKFAYRQSRKTNCNHPGNFENAQLTLGQNTPYKCDYPGTRVEYNATEILNAPPPTNYVH